MHLYHNSIIAAVPTFPRANKQLQPVALEQLQKC